MIRFLPQRHGDEPQPLARTTRPAPHPGTGAETRPGESHPRDDCESYGPGHQMHYVQQGQALRSSSVRVERVLVDGDRVELHLHTGERFEWRHHDPARLAAVLALFPSARVVYPDFHALRVGPYWFNCAPDVFEACGGVSASSPAVDRPSGDSDPNGS